MTTRYYIERETAIPGEWERFPFFHETPNEAHSDAGTSANAYARVKPPVCFRVIEVTEKVVGIYGRES